MMTLLEKIRTRLDTQDWPNILGPLFCETLRWGAPKELKPRALTLAAPINATITAVPIAQLSGLPVYRIDWPKERLPTVTDRRAVERALQPVHREHLLCYVAKGGREAAFVWARRRDDGKPELKTLPYEAGTSARTTIERLAKLAFSLEELGLFGEPPITRVTDKLNAAFSVEAVTQQFYKEVANWYFWARSREDVHFPPDVRTEADRALFLIRLLTRLVFCWFLRKKQHPKTRTGLLPDGLFDDKQIRRILNDASPAACTYYLAVLQNLFFATLNTEMDPPGEPLNRRFSGKNDNDHMIHAYWRHADLLRDSEAFEGMLRSVPFLNGGLFECLDDRVPVEGLSRTVEIRIDGFSDKLKNQPKLPNDLFFGEERVVDLSGAYGDDGRRSEKVRPLLAILHSYNFTLTENTPFEQEVALDPELLGHVFENLLAAFNPETGTVARKATGSFYTPRVVVDWMVDQALTVHLGKALAVAASEDKADAGERDPRLEQLLRWDDALCPAFEPSEVEALIDAIDGLKVLDPACGSGAFPMGMLQKLVHVLRKLDPNNTGWKRRQEIALNHITSASAREQARLAVERAFSRNNDDYGRKLYLIENCLYGVDIQPIACQIAKLRFFIALIVDQSIDADEPNFGILPLPNLETKIVAANTLLGLKRGQLRLSGGRVRKLEDELKQVRHDYFTARRYKDKKALRKRDRELSAELAQALAESGELSPHDTKRLAEWNPYDAKTGAAEFFDPVWMYGLEAADGKDDGVFDIVVGNPPYVRQEQLRSVSVTGSDGRPQPLKDALKELYWCYTGTADLYVYFFERSLQLLRQGGTLSFITSNKYMRAAYGKNLRALLAYATAPRAVLDFGDSPMFTAIAYPCIVVTEKIRSINHGTGTSDLPSTAFLTAPERFAQYFQLLDRNVRVHTWKPGAEVWHFPDIFASEAHDLAQRDLKPDGWRLESPVRLRLLERLHKSGTPLVKYVEGRFYYGIKTGLNEAFVVDRATRDRLIKEHPSSSEVLKPFLRGRDVKRWRCEFSDRYLIQLESSENVQHPWSGKSDDEAERAFAKSYPAIHARFDSMRNALLRRSDKGHHFWELRSCNYWQEFEQPKIVFGRFMDKPTYAFDITGLFHNDALYFASRVTPYAVATLNSPINWWFLRQLSTDLQNGYLQALRQYQEQIPIAPATPDQQQSCEHLAEALIWLHGPGVARKDGGTPVQLMIEYFEQWLNGLVYELFFADELHARNLRLFDETARLRLPDLNDVPPAQRLNRLVDVFEQAYDDKGALRGMLYSLRSLEVVRIIEEPTERLESTTSAEDNE